MTLLFLDAILSRVESSLLLRPTISRPVCLGIKHPSGAYDQIFITVRQLWVCWCVEDGSVVYNFCWPSPAQSSSGPSSLGLGTIFYCLRFETSLFVACYDSQGYGGGIRTRLHTGMVQFAPITQFWKIKLAFYSGWYGISFSPVSIYIHFKQRTRKYGWPKWIQTLCNHINMNRGATLRPTFSKHPGFHVNLG
jgi:hypothetical protein